MCDVPVWLGGTHKKTKHMSYKSYFVETIGNANEEVIREYVQSQLKVMDEGERAGTQLKLF